MHETLAIETADQVETIDLTDRIESIVSSEATDGTCTVFVPHTTAGIVVNEAERGLLGDVESRLESLVPEDAVYEHDRMDDNATAHLRSMLLGSSVSIPVRDGGLALGTWQSVLFFEGDGPRSRSVEVSIQS
ncbi:MAG: secondary thiamine-phosphate synthase enzyme YjbQ [Halodesulfurarchaeum sp.]